MTVNSSQHSFYCLNLCVTCQNVYTKKVWCFDYELFPESSSAVLPQYSRDQTSIKLSDLVFYFSTEALIPGKQEMLINSNKCVG